MQYVLGVLGKRFTDLRFDELIALMAVLFLCVSSVAYAISVLVRQFRKLDSESNALKGASSSFNSVGRFRDFRGFTD